MMSRLALPMSVLLAAPAASAQDAVPKNDLSITFVGELDTPRARAFVSFLRERFRAVAAFARTNCDPAELAKADVVVLDWDQQSGINNWTKWAEDRQEPSSPLGNREDWKSATVLIGSAGLSLASAWSVRGSSG